MDTGKDDPGRPGLFAEAFPDPRSRERRDAERVRVREQVRGLSLRETDARSVPPMLGGLQGRRSSATFGTAVQQFDVIRVAGNVPTLVGHGEILMRKDTADFARYEALLVERHGFIEEPEGIGGCPEIADVVARFVKDIDAEALAQIGLFLRSRGVAASVNHIAPLAAIIKGQGGAEPSEPARAYVQAGPTTSAAAATVVAVIDTGIAAEKRSDGWLDHDAITRVADENIDEIDKFPMQPEPDGYLDFASGHGTFVVGIVQQVAPGATIKVYRAVDSDGIGSEVRVACAMVRAVTEGAQILNLSLGTQSIDDGMPIALEAALELIADIEHREDREVLIVAAAGNYGDTRPCWPAAFRRVVAVAALNDDLTPALDWSSRGVWVDCSTVGEGVMSTYLAGKESTDFDPDPDTFGKDSWAVWSGTSFAAPQVCGAVARLCDERGLRPREALEVLLDGGTYVPNFGRAVRILPGT